MIEIPALVTSAWTILQPYFPMIAAKGAEEIGKTAVTEVWAAIKNKFDTKHAAKEALEELLKRPEDTDAQGGFRMQLRKMMEEDQSFATDLAKLLEAAGADYKAQVIGNGAIAQGDGATAVGKNAIHVGGNVSGSNIITGNENTVTNGSAAAEKKERRKK